MTGLLKPTERLVFAGYAKLRAPNGTPLPAVPQYMIVPAEEADPLKIKELNENEGLVIIGQVHNDRKSAEERYEAYKAGQKVTPPIPGTNLYIKEAKSDFNVKTGLSRGEEEVCESLVGDFLSEFSVAMRKMKAVNHPNKKKKEV